jgi:hypothetical protein
MRLRTTPDMKIGGHMSNGTLVIKASHNPLQFFLLFLKPKVVINGETSTGSWGEQSFDVAEGSHEVEVYFPYLGRKSGHSKTAIKVTAGSVTKLKYDAPFVVTMAGKLVAYA